MSLSLYQRRGGWGGGGVGCGGGLEMEGRGRAGWIHGGWRLVYGALAWGEMGRRGDEGMSA